MATGALVLCLLQVPTSGAAGAPTPSADSRAQGLAVRVTAPDLNSEAVNPSSNGRSADSAASECPSVRQAVRFYGVRVDHWRVLMGAGPKDLGHAQTGKTCPRYLAHVLQRKAYALRHYYERWHERQIATSVRRLDRGLAGSPMAGTGEILERYGRRYHVSPYFMAAVAATESSLGVAACSNNRFNVWGLSSCGSGWYVPAFRSWDEAILFYARFLSGRWPSHSTPYSFRGYAACSDCWGRKVSEWMGRLFGVPARTVYP